MGMQYNDLEVFIQNVFSIDGWLYTYIHVYIFSS